MKAERIAKCFPYRAFCNIFDLHYSIIRLIKRFSVILRVAVLHMFYCILRQLVSLQKSPIFDAEKMKWFKYE